MKINKKELMLIQEHAKFENPNECCGILGGKDNHITDVYQIDNVVASPTRYLMDPEQQLKATKDLEDRGLEIIGFYHSHTNSEAYPSSTDVRLAIQSGWLDILYILISVKYSEVKAFKIESTGEIIEEDVVICED
ncbi:MAG: M67 family metallopeptidase [SAR202 cluster bacterium]|nr:M67 family metallopeptidase [SAR202 cluster bacterium]|tara:strand:- start:265 stop:669 length:405 start_codon:yes stop_codon:yes gene_type:complete